RHGHQRPRARGDDGGPLARRDRGGGMTRSEALARLRAQVEAGAPVIGAGAGTGLSAKLAEAGGADLIIIYNSGRYRMGGRGSLAGLMPYGDANEIVVDMAREVLPVVKETPVLAGVCGTDPFRLMPVFLDELKRIGFSGVQNFPTVGPIGAESAKTLDECVPLIQAMHDAAKSVSSEILVLCHGGPIAEPDDAAYVLARTEGVVGFFGASSMERLPTEIAMTENMQRFKAIPIERRDDERVRHTG